MDQAAAGRPSSASILVLASMISIMHIGRAFALAGCLSAVEVVVVVAGLSAAPLLCEAFVRVLSLSYLALSLSRQQLDSDHVSEREMSS